MGSATLQVERLAWKDVALQHRQRIKGHYISGVRWRDREGIHEVVFSSTGKFKSKAACVSECYDAEFYGYHFAGSNAKLKTVWKLTDFERECESDLFVGLVPDSLSVTDLDHDGIAEVSFMYKLACRSDVSPARLKLMLYEGKAKYAMRGYTVVEGHKEGAVPVEDLSWQRMRSGVKEYALRRWKQFERETNFEQF